MIGWVGTIPEMEHLVIFMDIHSFESYSIGIVGKSVPKRSA